MNSRPNDEELAAKTEHAVQLQHRRHYLEAAECYREVVSAYVPEPSYLALRCGWGYAECLYHTGRAHKALTLMRRILPVWEERFDLAHPTSISALSFFIKLLRKEKAWKELTVWQRKLITAESSCYGTDSFKYVDALAVLHTALHNLDSCGEEHRELTKQFRSALRRSSLKWLRVWRRPWRRPKSTATPAAKHGVFRNGPAKPGAGIGVPEGNLDAANRWFFPAKAPQRGHRE